MNEGKLKIWLEDCAHIFHTGTRPYKKVRLDNNHLNVISQDIKKNKAKEEK